MDSSKVMINHIIWVTSLGSTLSLLESPTLERLFLECVRSLVQVQVSVGSNPSTKIWCICLYLRDGSRRTNRHEGETFVE